MCQALYRSLGSFEVEVPTGHLSGCGQHTTAYTDLEIGEISKWTAMISTLLFPCITPWEGNSRFLKGVEKEKSRKPV